MSIFTVAWDRKMRGSAEDCDRVGVQFIPLAFESLGGWHKEAEKEVKKLAVAMARQSGKAESECCNQATTLPAPDEGECLHTHQPHPCPRRCGGHMG